MFNTIIFLLTIISSYMLYINYQRHKNENLYENPFLLSFIKKYGGNTLSHLLFLQDKQIYLAQNGSVLISYRPIGSKYFVLGDPIGDDDKLEKGLDEFLNYARDHRATPIFYQTSERFLSFYHDRGYRFFKVGEEANVSLEQFTIEGKKAGKLRTTKNKFTREGYEFSVVYPPYSPAFINELRNVSNEWLADKHEKSFSVSSFREDYINLFPVSILRDKQGKLVAFASLPSNENGTISIDLMRYTADSPSGAMDMVFLSTFLWAKEKNYIMCSLGMSPLSNVGTAKGACYKEKLARLAFLHGCKFYNFKGLRNYKAKFATKWTPRYLVYKKSLLFIVLFQLLFIIQKKPVAKQFTSVKSIFSDKRAV